jgi:hypothetical protein
MPVNVNLNKIEPKTMRDLLFGQVALIIGGDFSGFVVTRATSVPTHGYISFTTNNHTPVDAFSEKADYPIRILQSGESFTVTIP